MNKTLRRGSFSNHYDWNKIVVKRESAFGLGAPGGLVNWAAQHKPLSSALAKCIMVAAWLVHFQRAYSDLITLWEDETIYSCISPFKSEETFLKAHEHNTPQVLLDRIASDASSQTRHGQGNGISMISWDIRLGSIGKEDDR